MWKHSLLWLGQGNAVLRTPSFRSWLPHAVMLEEGEDQLGTRLCIMSWQMFPLPAEGKTGKMCCVIWESFSVISSWEQWRCCLLPVCCKPTLEIVREVIYWQYVLNQEIPLRVRLPKFLCLHGLFLLFPELMLSGGCCEAPWASQVFMLRMAMI